MTELLSRVDVISVPHEDLAMSMPRLSLVILAVEDRTLSLAFYREAFGWSLEVDAPAYAELALPDGMRLGIYDRRGFGRNFGHQPRPSGAVTGTELYLYVDDIERAGDRVMRAGGRRLDQCRPRDWGDEVAYYSDPDGNVLALARRLS
jgi:predicted enzyme related to lactoylglutathione lyase